MFSYIYGFETQKITIDSNLIDIPVRGKPIASLEEVVVAAYRSVKGNL
jgi:hypothetical protein